MSSNYERTRASRRVFLGGTAVAAGAAGFLQAADGADSIKVGLVGCGGRGTGAAAQALQADDHAVLTAVADIDRERVDLCLEAVAERHDGQNKVQVDKERQFLGLDAYQQVIDSDVDVVLLATPPGFRPQHLRACIEAGKHVFCEKPMAVDAPGVRSVHETVAMAKQKRLSVVAGFCWRYNSQVMAAMEQVHSGGIGDVVAYYATFYTNPVKPMPPRYERPLGMSDVEWQIRNWYNFVWLCGDGLVEQAVHSADKIAWAMGDEPPESCVAVGGRQIPAHDGNIFDHFEVNYLYPKGVRAFLGCRQIAGCHRENADYILGDEGHPHARPRHDGPDRGGESVGLQGTPEQHVPGGARRPLPRDSSRRAGQRRQAHGRQHPAGDPGPHVGLHRTGDHLGAGDGVLGTEIPGQSAMGHAARPAATGPARPHQVRLAVRKPIPIALAVAMAGHGADFQSEIRPLLEAQCLACHSDSNPLGGLSIETRESALEGGASGPSIVPGKPGESPLLGRSILETGAAGAMPPAGPRLESDQLASLRSWILDGAVWPEPLRARPEPTPSEREEMALVMEIHRRVASRARREGDDPFEPYEEPVPGGDATLEMVPIPSGAFTMGTPADEAGRNDDEGPRRQVRVEEFWMSAHEITWDAFRRFMLREAEVYLDPDKVAAAVSSPTPPYMEMSFGMGISGYPAISMTQHAASKYAQWLTAKTGRFYRLPTEAEWEYACRAGSQTAYSFGSDPAMLAEFAWFWGNSDAQYRPVGTRKPNPWGLYDMHGNVWEWTLDRHSSYEPVDGSVVNPWVEAEPLYPRVVRGGSWMDDPESLRCGARRASDDSWKMQDPQLPKSIWYHTDAQWLGFRLVRPREVPSAEAMHDYWNSATGAR